MCLCEVPQISEISRLQVHLENIKSKIHRRGELDGGGAVVDRIGSHVCARHAVKNQTQPVLARSGPRWQGRPRGVARPPTSAGRDARSTRRLRAPVGTDGDYVPAPLMKLVAQKQGALGMFRGKFRSRLSKQLLALVTAAVRAADQSARIRKSGSAALSVGLCPIFCWCGDWCRG